MQFLGLNDKMVIIIIKNNVLESRDIDRDNAFHLNITSE